MFKKWYKKLLKRYSEVQVNPEHYGDISDILYSFPKVKRVYPSLVSSKIVEVEPWAQKTIDNRENLESNLEKLMTLLEE
jgi:hypothetical protein